MRFGGSLDDFSRSTVLNVGFRLDRIMDCLRPVHFQIFGGHRRNVVPNPRTMYWSVNSSLSAPSSALRALRTSATVRSRFCAEHNPQRSNSSSGRPLSLAPSEAQHQQPASPMFGNLGTTNTATSHFGGFGQNTTQPVTTTSVFGAPEPATGFGANGGGTSGLAGVQVPLVLPTPPQPRERNKPATTGFGAVTAVPSQDGTAAPVTTGIASPPLALSARKTQLQMLTFNTKLSPRCQPSNSTQM
ncbi:hypothetical protein SCLCIDRAFT_32536 [Scleroderma citrinum Foug A]|uniref:Uncharacterized protein n=1 Tax=Scleroderma citrinum Foug A TaxID=1036808 RepID=A0A0C2YSF4_9AGAM|nr:hypothetical protein SCLCIDRAFT_32536 [Scleroderma citrinum Foug A]